MVVAREFSIEVEGKGLSDISTTIANRLSEQAHHFGPGVIVRVQVILPGGGRRNIKVIEKTLEISVTDQAKKKRIWANDEYNFDFGQGKFTWDGASIHLTTGERLALFQKLIMGVKVQCWHQFKANMRKRLGREFLEGL